MQPWNADLYMEYGNERTQPSIDLITRLNLSNPQRIIDLGCGPGNSTAVLRARWPDAGITGLDSSPEMLEAARKIYPEGKWIEGDAACWKADEPFDLIFSNAAFHWIPDHARLVPHLLEQLRPDGVLAFQLPRHIESPLHRLMLEIADDPQWADRMPAAKGAMTIESPGFYYDLLCTSCRRIDIWETEYCHQMESPEAIVDWIASTGLRPFLQALSTEEQRKRFIELLKEGVTRAYPRQRDGKVLFPFRRLFVIAGR